MSSGNVVVSAGGCSVTISSSLTVTTGEINTIGTLGVGTSLVGVPSKSGQQLNVKGLLDSATIAWTTVGNDVQGAVGGSVTPSAHASTHELGGSDVLDLTGLTGLLGTAQTPTAHASTHDAGGSDVISDLGPITFSGAIDWTSATVVNGLVDGDLLLTDAAGTGFGILQFGGTTSANPGIKRVSNDTVAARLADDSGYCQFISSNYIGGSFTAGSTSDISWSTRTVMRSPADGQLQLLNSALSSFDALLLGPASASFIRLEPSSGRLNVRLGNDSTEGGLTAGNILANQSVDVPAGQAYRSVNRFRIDSNADGNIRLRDWAGTSFGLLQLGGDSASHPAIKRGGNTTVHLRLGDDSGWASLVGQDLIAAGVVQAGTTKEIEWSGRSSMSSPADGSVLLTNAANTGFTGLLWGGTTSAFPGLFRSSTDLEVKLATGLAYTDITALDFNLSGGGSFASHAARHLDGGADEITIENLATSGAAGTVPTSDGLGGLTMLAVGATDQIQVYYVGKHGSDSNNGKSPESAFLTITKGLTEAAAQSPSSTNRFVVRVLDAGRYTENVIIPSYVSLHGPSATVVSPGSGHTVTVSNDSSIKLEAIEHGVAGLYALLRSAGSGTSYAAINRIELSGSGSGVFNNGAGFDVVLLCEIETIRVGNGIGILHSTAGHTHIDIEDIYLVGDNSTGVRNTGTGSIIGRVTHIVDLGAVNTSGITITNGRTSLQVDTITADTAWNVASPGQLDLCIAESAGTKTVTGTLNLTEIGVTPAHASSHDSGGGDPISSLGGVTFSGVIDWITGSRVSGFVDGYLLMQNQAGTGFTGLRFGGASNLFPMLKVNSNDLDLKSSDDSSFTDFRCNKLTAFVDVIAGSDVRAGPNANDRIYWLSSTTMTAPSDGSLLLQNASLNSFNALFLGGVTNSFPAIRRVGSEIYLRRGDDSTWAGLRCGDILSGGVVEAAAASRFQWSGRSKIFSPLDGNILLQDSSATTFGLLQLGGTTASWPAIAPNGASLRVKLANDAALTTIEASNFLAGSTSLLAHGLRHQNGGADEISVAGLSGTLADPQTPTSHVGTHANGGSDELNVAGLNGVLSDPQTPSAHASTHGDGGTDEIDAGNLGSGGATSGYVLTADGAGGASWSTVGGGTHVKVTSSDTTAGYLDSKLLAGAGMTRTIVNPGADEDYRMDVIANADGSIAVNADNIQVGVLANDTQHGIRGGGTQHALAIASGASGFLSGADKQKINDLATTYAALNHASRHAGGGGDPITNLGAVTFSGKINWTSATQLDGLIDGELQILNAASTGVVGIFLGPKTASFPFIKRNGANFDFRNGSDTSFVNASLASLTATQLIELGAAFTLRWTGRSRIQSPVNGNLLLTNAAESDFGLIQFGGITSAYPALKRVSNYLQVRTANDGLFADIEALDFNLSVGGSLASHASRHANGGGDAVDHDTLTNYVAAEHIDWTTDQGATNIDANNIPSIVETGASSVLSWAAIADTQVLRRSGTSIVGQATSATPAASTIPIADGWGVLADGWISSSSVAQHEGFIDHDQLLNFVANEHIDWTTDQGATNISPRNVPQLTETGGPTDLTLGAVADGQFLQRSGSTLVGAAVPTPVFGDNYDYAATAARATTTSTTPQVRTSITTGTLTGTYMIEWFALLDSNNKEIFLDVYDSTNTTVLQTMRIKPSTTDLRWPVSGFIELSFVAQARTLQLRYYSLGDLVGITNARLKIYRVE